MAERVERKLWAILAADVAGYSRLMGADEEGTLAALNAHRRNLFEPMVASHRGRIVKTTGDGFLVAFGSVVDAVRCAVAVQSGMAERNADTPQERALIFRIGINVGDIVEQDGDIFGDGVNIAARLESIAKPGGICVSARVQEDASGRVDVAFEDIGEQSLKNIARPVRAYRVRPTGSTADPQPVAAPARTTPPQLPDKPALAVLPFQNMSGDAEQEYFADGVVEDIITGLSRFKSFAVIARNSSFVYKGRAVDVRQAANEMGVRYVLEGSVRRAGDRLRITAQLIDGTTGAHLWADRFEGSIKDVFEVQDRITESVVTIIEPQVRHAEIARARRKRSENMDAYDLYLRVLAATYTGRENENTEAFDLIRRALELEPDHAPFLDAAIWILDYRVIAGWPPLTADDRAASLAYVHRAVANAHGDAAILSHCGATLVHGHDYDRGMQLCAIAVETNPNNQMALMCAGIAELHAGSVANALKYSQRALLMSPNDSLAHWPITAIAHAHMAMGNFNEALKAAEQSIAINPSYDPTYWMLISANAQLGRLEQAKTWLAKLREFHPGVTIARIAAGQPDKFPDRMAAIYAGLKLAGMLEA